MTRDQRRWLVGILVMSAGLRLAWVLYATRVPSGPMAGDSWFYLRYGEALARGDGYIGFQTGQPTAYYPIGYPAVIAVLSFLLTHTPLPNDLPNAASLCNAVASTATVAFVFLIARRCFDTTTALVAAAILAVFPNVIFYTGIAALETTFIVTLLAAVAVIVTADWSTPPTRSRLLLFGVLLGLSALVRPFSLPVLAGLGVTSLVAGFGWRRAAASVGWASLAFAVVVAPWLVRNATVMDTVTFSTNMGDTVCIDRYHNSDGRFRFTDSPRCAPARTPEIERNRENIGFALRFVRDHPIEELELVGRRLWYMMESDSDGLLFERSDPFFGRQVRSILTRTANGYFFASLPLALIGVLSLCRGRRPERIFVLTTIATLMAVPLLLWGNTRFHVPALPFIAITAASPLAWLGRRLAARVGEEGAL